MGAALQIATDFVKAHEGCKLNAYRDSGGVWTIGYGDTGTVVQDGLVWIHEEADSALRLDICGASVDVVRLKTRLLSDQQMAALMSFVFNLGAAAFAKSTLLTCVNNCQWLDAAREFVRWDHADGKEVRGLLIRRLEEAALFLKGSTNE